MNSPETAIHTRFRNFPKRDLRERLNLVAAAEAHVLWKARLGHHVRGSAVEPLESALLGQDGVCQLGVWINSSVFAPLQDCSACLRLKEAHQNFHQYGEDIMAMLKAGNRPAAESLYNHQYSLALHDILQSLSEINHLLQEA